MVTIKMMRMRTRLSNIPTHHIIISNIKYGQALFKLLGDISLLRTVDHNPYIWTEDIIGKIILKSFAILF